VAPSWSTFLFEAANFLLLAALLGWAFFRPVREALESRRAALEAESREAAERLAEAERKLEEARTRRAEIEGSLEELRERVRVEAERERDRLLEEARARAEREREALDAELAAQRRGQATRIAGDAAAAAREIVVRLLERIGGPDLESALLEAATRELEKLAASGPVASLIVESSRPLTPAALSAIARAAGLATSEVSAREVPELVAGVRLLTSRGLVDASAAGLAAHAERALSARIGTPEADDA
jgi:F-type H+-transporting ATPase subunit b